jgi:type I restriction enzyme S subunit
MTGTRNGPVAATFQESVPMSSKTITPGTNEEARPGLVPKLRFPAFRGAEAWTLEAGDSLFDQINNRNPEPGLAVLAITQEHGAIPRHMIDYHVSVTEKSIVSYKVVRAGDFIISLRSFQGGIEYSRYHGICSPAYVILRRRSEGSDEYFRHYLKTDEFIRLLTKNLEGLRDGKMISYAQFSELMLPVPKLSEQQKIAECLSSVDELVAAQARKVDALKTHKHGLMRQLFPREGETQPRARLPQFQSTGEWNTKKLGSFCKVGDIDHKMPSSVVDGVPYVMTGDFFGINGIDYKNAKKVSQEDYEKLSKKIKPEFGDIAIARYASVGAVRYIEARIKFLISYSCAIIKCSKSECSMYIYYALQSDAIQSRISLEVNPSSQKNIGIDSIKNLMIFLPPLPEQEEIAECFAAVDALITAETQELEVLKTHKKALMQQLFPSAEEMEA